MADNDLRAALERNLAAFESAGMTEDVKAVKARLAELEKADESEAELDARYFVAASGVLEASAEPVLGELKKADLLALAEERGLEVSESWTKAELVEVLESEEG
jgi:hypothetical protein